MNYEEKVVRNNPSGYEFEITEIENGKVTQLIDKNGSVYNYK